LNQDGDGREVGEEEARTVARVSKDDFERLAREHLPRLYSVARQLTDVGAEDLVQECLLRAYRAFGTLSAPEAGGAWMQAILVNAYRDRLRKESRAVQEVRVEDVDDFSLYRTIAEEDPFPYSDSLHLDFLHSFGKEDVRAVLMRLPDIYRAPLVLRYMQGFATKEIARMLEAPLGTILARLHRGRKMFEKELWRYASETGLLAKEVTP
jgi:RNA polymerase sigma-70 factor, ECF subfamily